MYIPIHLYTQQYTCRIHVHVSDTCTVCCDTCITIYSVFVGIAVVDCLTDLFVHVQCVHEKAVVVLVHVHEICCIVHVHVHMHVCDVV